MTFLARPDHRRWVRFVFLSLLALCCLTLVAPSIQQLQAQQAQDSSVQGASDTISRPNIFLHMIRSVHYFGLVFLVVSVLLVFLIVLLAMDLRMAQAIPPEFVAGFTDTVNKRKFKEAYDLARQDNSFLARVLTTGMSRLQYGIEDAREAALSMVETIRSSKEQLITYLATIGTLGPLLGLVGTVYSMMKAFMQLGEKGRTPDPQELAQTLSEALVVTLIGISLSLPAIFCHAFFRNRLIKLTMDTSNVADDLLTQMYHNSKRPSGPVPVGAPVPAPGPVTAMKAE